MTAPVETTVKKRPHTYSPDERAELSENVNRLLDQLDEIKAEQKRSAAEYKSRIANAESSLTSSRNNLRQGYEPREHVCSINRDKTTGFVSYNDTTSGELIAREKMTATDWDIVSGKRHPQPDLFGDEPANQPPAKLYPNADADGNVIAGPKTDLYNYTYADSPYKHLASDVDFVVTLPSASHEGFDAEMQVSYNEAVAQIAHYSRENLEGALVTFREPIEDEKQAQVATALAAYVEGRLLLLDKNPEEDTAAQVPEGEQSNAADDGPISKATMERRMSEDGRYEPNAADDGPEGGADDDTDKGDDNSDGDEPKQPKRTPTRPAKKMPRNVK